MLSSLALHPFRELPPAPALERRAGVPHAPVRPFATVLNEQEQQQVSHCALWQTCSRLHGEESG